jgi:hypothetical protein
MMYFFSLLDVMMGLLVLEGETLVKGNTVSFIFLDNTAINLNSKDIFCLWRQASARVCHIQVI